MNKNYGCIKLIGIGPGNFLDMTYRAVEEIINADVIIGYTVYTNLVQEALGERINKKEIISTPMKKEVDRCNIALEKALEGKNIAFVCSGDAGIYAMAGIMCEVAEDYSQLDIKIIPGVSALSSGGAVLGAPLIHDFCVVSLSDLLTPIELIEKRIMLAAKGDFVICFYNPKSIKRSDYLKNAIKIIKENREVNNIYCGFVKNIGRDGECSVICTIDELESKYYDEIDMFTTVFIGNSQTKIINNKLITPRGYIF